MEEIIVLILAIITLKSGVSGCLSFIVSVILFGIAGNMLFDTWGLIAGVLLATVLSFKKVSV